MLSDLQLFCLTSKYVVSPLVIWHQSCCLTSNIFIFNLLMLCLTLNILLDLHMHCWPLSVLFDLYIWVFDRQVWHLTLLYKGVFYNEFGCLASKDIVWPPKILFDLQRYCLTFKDSVWPPKILFYLQRYCLTSKDIVWPPKMLFDHQRYCFPSNDIVWAPKILFDLQRCCLTSKDIVWPLFKLCSVCRANNTENIGNMTINCEDINVEGGPNKTSGLAYMSAITIGNNKHTSHNGNMKSWTLHLVWLKLRRVCGFEYNTSSRHTFSFSTKLYYFKFSVWFTANSVIFILSWFPTNSDTFYPSLDFQPTLL